MTECHKLDTEEQVFFYEQDFYVLSNFSAFNVKYQGMIYATSEHAYHAQKFSGENNNKVRLAIKDLVTNAPSAHEAFKIACSLKAYYPPNWETVKVPIMREILHAKALQHEYVYRKLMSTGSRELIEDSWRDDFWGWGPNKNGKNVLGKLWMELRDEFSKTPIKHINDIYNF